MRVLPVTEGAELSTKDVDPQWLKDWSGDVPTPSGRCPTRTCGRG
ncbi:hypothetical protein [Streptomyces sp. NPDC007917]